MIFGHTPLPRLSSSCSDGVTPAAERATPYVYDYKYDYDYDDYYNKYYYEYGY